MCDTDQLAQRVALGELSLFLLAEMGEERVHEGDRVRLSIVPTTECSLEVAV